VVARIYFPTSGPTRYTSTAFAVGIEGLHPFAVRIGADAVEEQDGACNDGRADHAEDRHVRDKERGHPAALRQLLRRQDLDIETGCFSGPHLFDSYPLVALDPAPDPEAEAKTIALLEEHAADIRKLQIDNKFTMLGIS
jgi:hypothetical protein